MAKKYKKAKTKTTTKSTAKTKKRKVTAKAKKSAAKKRTAKKRTTRQDPCIGERFALKRDKDRAKEIREFLPEAPTDEKPALQAELQLLVRQIIPGDVQRLEACLRLHPSR